MLYSLTESGHKQNKKSGLYFSNTYALMYQYCYFKYVPTINHFPGLSFPHFNLLRSSKENRKIIKCMS